MSEIGHGISVGIERFDNHFYLSLVAKGTLTHDDYVYMVPIIESALNGVEHAKIDVLADLTQLYGWELRAAWDDLKLGLTHGRAFNKVAIVGESNLLQFLTKIADWFTPYQTQIFDSTKEARQWLKG
ncbi:STAS/SEC14 domain-containing protein [Shewanella sp. DAU334]|uniref:STAS/SEC14 domain-containing protein n=1 Tax=Shewanella youngdeokensis TaxID=2999068 RepID=A0ABZ0K4L1_9GAMM|nr:STAS/SEC14 domain-containing protein [Shewanella sp. DAU334]